MKSKTGFRTTSRRALYVVEGFADKLRTSSEDDWAHSLDKLNQAFDCPADPKSTVSVHRQIRDILPFYVSDEQMGSDIRHTYPFLWEHLRTCQECKDLCDMLAAQNPPPRRDNHLRTERGNQPRLNLLSEATAWQKAEPTTGTHSFTFSKSYIQTLLTPAVQSITTRGSSLVPEILLISDSFLHKADLIYFNAWLETSDEVGKAEKIRLQFTPPGCSRILKASLRWNGKRHPSTRVKNDLIFQNLELPFVHRTGQSTDHFGLDFTMNDKKKTR